MKGVNNKPALLTPCNLEGYRASFNKGDCMINYRRFGRSRVLSIRLDEFHTAVFPVRVKNFQVTKAKTGTTKSFRRPIASVHANLNPVDTACEIIQRPVA